MLHPFNRPREVTMEGQMGNAPMGSTMRAPTPDDVVEARVADELQAETANHMQETQGRLERSFAQRQALLEGLRAVDRRILALQGAQQVYERPTAEADVPDVGAFR